MKIDAETYAKLPPHLQALFVKLPNPGREEVLAGFPETGASSDAPRNNRADDAANIRFTSAPDGLRVSKGHADLGGSAARFFYTAKADKTDRLGSKHPTVKPVDLMQWLCRLVTPPRVVELVCESCSNPTHEYTSLQGLRGGPNQPPSRDILLGEVPSGDLQAEAPAMQNVRDTDQQATGEVLLATVSGGGDEGGGSDASRPPMQELRSNLQADEERRAAILLAEVCGDGDRPAETQGADQDRDRILAGLQAGPSDGVESGLHHGASPDHVGANREAAEADRGRSPRKRGQGRQSPGEPRTDEQAGARPGAEDPEESGSQMPPLSGLYPAQQFCPKCGSSLTRIERPGLVLDPFAGSGSTGMACMAEGFNAILIEREAQFVADIKNRIAHVSGEDTPLFMEASA